MRRTFQRLPARGSAERAEILLQRILVGMAVMVVLFLAAFYAGRLETTQNLREQCEARRTVDVPQAVAWASAQAARAQDDKRVKVAGMPAQVRALIPPQWLSRELDGDGTVSASRLYSFAALSLASRVAQPCDERYPQPSLIPLP